MRNIGIIAEYNPFHNGHKFQIDYAKKILGFDNVVVAMSGPFTQRGEVSLTGKYTRAEMALHGGADLVLEIPVLFATASAKEFANAGVTLLHNTGLVSDILFGTESATEKDILAISKAIIEAEASKEYNDIIRDELAKGSSFAVARSKAISSFICASHLEVPSNIEEIISTPNNILAIEYTCCIIKNNYNINIHCLNRSDNGYHSMLPHGEFASATFIRSGILATDNYSQVENYISKETLRLLYAAPVLAPNSVSLLLHERLIKEDDFTDYLDCTEAISNKIINHRNEFTTFTEFVDALKSKELSYTRISRVLIHIILGIKKDLFDEAKANNYITYIKVLGCSEEGTRLMGKIKQSPSKEHALLAQKIMDLDSYAYNVARALATNASGIIITVENSRKFLKIQHKNES